MREPAIWNNQKFLFRQLSFLFCPDWKTLHGKCKKINYRNEGGTIQLTNASWYNSAKNIIRLAFLKCTLGIAHKQILTNVSACLLYKELIVNKACTLTTLFVLWYAWDILLFFYIKTRYNTSMTNFSLKASAN